MSALDLVDLRTRFIARLVEEWPERNSPLDVIEQGLRVDVAGDDGPVVAIDLLGDNAMRLRRNVGGSDRDDREHRRAHG